MQTQVTPRYVNPPKAGKKFGNLKTADNDMWFVEGDPTQHFQAGTTYNVEYDVQTWGDMQAKVIRMPASGGNHWQAPPQPVQQPPQQGHNNPPQNGQVDKEKAMYVMGVVGRAMGSGQFAAADIPVLTEFALEGWATFVNGRRPKQTNNAPPPASQNDYGANPPMWPNDEPAFG